MISLLQDFNAQTPPALFEIGAMSVDVGNRLFPRARRNDPETSKAAALKAERFAKSHAGRILFALQRSQLTAHEIGLLTGLQVVQVDRRVSELIRDGSARVVLGHDGKDLTRGGFRVLEAA